MDGMDGDTGKRNGKDKRNREREIEGDRVLLFELQ